MSDVLSIDDDTSSGSVAADPAKDPAGEEEWENDSPHPEPTPPKATRIRPAKSPGIAKTRHNEARHSEGRLHPAGKEFMRASWRKAS